MIKFKATKAVGAISFSPYLFVELVKVNDSDEVINNLASFTIPLSLTTDEEVAVAIEIMDFFGVKKYVDDKNIIRD